MISPDFLKAVADRHGVTNAELEALLLAINNDNDSTAEIAEELGITSDAVRKRLGEVYQKFGIIGSGRGKLLSLQRMLEEQYQKHLSRRQVFIGWAGDDGKRLAEGLKETILKHPKIELFLASWDMTSNKPRLLGDADFGVACLTRSFSTWVNFDAGFLLGRLQNIKLLRLSEPLGGPLENLPQTDGGSKEDLIELLSDILDGDRPEAEDWVDLTFPKWEKLLQDVVEKPQRCGETKLNDAINLIVRSAQALKEDETLHRNNCLQQLVIHSVTSISKRLEHVPSYYSVPAALYPSYLLMLQEKFKVCVKALAIVGQKEHFWREETGREIAQYSHAESHRVFVFIKPEDFERNFELLLEHATKYHVYAMNYETLVKDFPEYARDMSIIEASGDKVLAIYEGIGTDKEARFSAGDETSMYEEVLNSIIKSSVGIPRVSQLTSHEILEIMRECRNLTFRRGKSRSFSKSVEKFKHVSLENYTTRGLSSRRTETPVKECTS